jgi:hypothetical protein
LPLKFPAHPFDYSLDRRTAAVGQRGILSD